MSLGLQNSAFVSGRQCVETEAGGDLCPQWGPCRKKRGPFVCLISCPAAHRLAAPTGRLRLRPGFAELGRCSGPTQFPSRSAHSCSAWTWPSRPQTLLPFGQARPGITHFVFQGAELLSINDKSCLIRNSSEIFKPKIEINLRGDFCFKSRKPFVSKHVTTTIPICLLSLFFCTSHSSLTTTLKRSCYCHFQMRKLRFEDARRFLQPLSLRSPAFLARRQADFLQVFETCDACHGVAPWWHFQKRAICLGMHSPSGRQSRAGVMVRRTSCGVVSCFPTSTSSGEEAGAQAGAAAADSPHPHGSR